MNKTSWNMGNTASRLKKIALAIAGVTVTLGHAYATGGGMQLCGDGSGYSWGYGSVGSTSHDCISNGFAFSLNNMSTSTGMGGFGPATARVTGYSGGRLELKGTAGISMLGVVNMNGNAITNLKDGGVSENSTDAVNGSQLFKVDQQVKDAYKMLNELASNGYVQQDSSTAALTVGAKTGGAEINFSGTEGLRRLTSIADGQDDHDAVSVGQLKASLGTGLDERLKDVIKYDDLSLDKITLSGANGTVIANLADGTVAEGSKEAVNGGQLYALQQQFGDLAYRVTDLEGSNARSRRNFSAKAEETTNTALGTNANASGENGTAVGQLSNASGENSTALGQNASATANNTVALGQGSVADRDNSVSVGAAGAERQITNVAEGTAPTDAVNVQQMHSKVESARRDAFGGVAAALAVAGLPQSVQPGRTLVSVGGGTYGGEFGTAVGVSYMTRGGQVTLKGSATTGGRGEFGGSIGAGFYL